ncbi:hypothetical protein HC762_00685 [bacterium]|nr:hypothetical protein [bacterium]
MNAWERASAVVEWVYSAGRSSQKKPTMMRSRATAFEDAPFGVVVLDGGLPAPCLNAKSIRQEMSTCEFWE